MAIRTFSAVSYGNNNIGEECTVLYFGVARVPVATRMAQLMTQLVAFAASGIFTPISAIIILTRAHHLSRPRGYG